MTNAQVRFKIDNTPAQAYINNQGGTKSVGLCNQAQELWKWYLLHQTIVSAEHLPGIHNRDADQASRIFNDRTEWMISPHLLREALSLLAVNPSIDMFASNLNNQFPIFCSWKPDPDTWKIGAFSFPWIQKGLSPCFPIILPGGKSSSKNHTRQVSQPSSCDTLVVFSTMVSTSEKFSHYTATISEGNKTDFSPSSLRGSPPLMEAAEASCMGCLRRQKKS